MNIIERDVIISLLRDADKLSGISEKLKPEYLNVPHLRWIYRKLISFQRKYNDLPRISYFISELAKSKLLTPEEKSRYKNQIRQLYRKKISSATTDYALEEIERFASKQQMIIHIERSLDKLEAGELEEAVSELTATTRIRIAEKDYIIDNWGESWRERQRQRKLFKKNPELAGNIRFPWKTLNKLIHGIQPKEVATIAGITNVGKSIALMLCGRSAFIDGKKVLHIEIEDSLDLVERRYDSSILGVPSEALKAFDFTLPERKKLNTKVELIRSVMGDNLYLVKCYPRRTSIVTIDRILWDLERKGWKPDFLIIDHADVMAPSQKQEQYRLDQSVVYWDLNTLAQIRNLPILTATHVAKQFKGKRAVAEGLAEAYDKARILNIVLTLNQLEETSSNMILFVAKNRDGPKGAEIPLLARYNIMRLQEARFITKEEE